MSNELFDSFKHDGEQDLVSNAEDILAAKLESDADGWLKFRRHFRRLLVTLLYVFVAFLTVMVMWIICAYVRDLTADVARVASFMSTFWSFLLTVLATLFLSFVVTPKSK